MKNVNAALEGKYFEIFRFNRVSEKIRNRIRDLCDSSAASKPAFVIFAGAKEQDRDSNIAPVISYQNPSAALVITRSPITLNARGEVNHLEKGSAYIIPGDRGRLRRRKAFLTSGAVGLVLLFTALMMWPEGGNRNASTRQDGVANLTRENASDFPPLPAEYLDLDFKISREILYAQEGGKDDDLDALLDKSIRLLMSKAVFDCLDRNPDILPFFKAVLDDRRFSIMTRLDSLRLLSNIAFHQRKPEIILQYRRHPEAFIRQELKEMIPLLKIRFEKAGIPFDPKEP